MKRERVIDLLMPQAPCVFSSIKLTHGDSRRVVPRFFLSNRLDLLVWAKMEELGWRFEGPEIAADKIGVKKRKQAQGHWELYAPKKTKAPTVRHADKDSLPCPESQRPSMASCGDRVLPCHFAKEYFDSVEALVEYMRSNVPAWAAQVDELEKSDEEETPNPVDHHSQNAVRTRRSYQGITPRPCGAPFAPEANLLALPPKAASLIYSLCKVQVPEEIVDKKALILIFKAYHGCPGMRRARAFPSRVASLAVAAVA